jgi:hypothetical protein
MTSVFELLDSIYNDENTNVDDERSLLRRTKKLHSETPTRDLNKKYVIPGYKFIKREGTIQLVKENGSAQSPATPSYKSTMQKNRAEAKTIRDSTLFIPHSITNDYYSNADFSTLSNGNDDETDSFATYKLSPQ